MKINTLLFVIISICLIIVAYKLGDKRGYDDGQKDVFNGQYKTTIQIAQMEQKKLQASVDSLRKEVLRLYVRLGYGTKTDSAKSVEVQRKLIYRNLNKVGCPWNKKMICVVMPNGDTLNFAHYKVEQYIESLIKH